MAVLVVLLLLLVTERSGDASVSANELVDDGLVGEVEGVDSIMTLVAATK